MSWRARSDLITAKPIIIVIDDDPSILRALRRLVSGAGFEVRTFDRPSTLLKSDLPKAGACLIVDIDLPEMNGAESQGRTLTVNEARPREERPRGGSGGGYGGGRSGGGGGGGGGGYGRRDRY